eukprot:SAG11_NODE_1063_length_5996_cov_2.201798_2_plen_106_part_00
MPTGAPRQQVLFEALAAPLHVELFLSRLCACCSLRAAAALKLRQHQPREAPGTTVARQRASMEAAARAAFIELDPDECGWLAEDDILKALAMSVQARHQGCSADA